MNRILIASKDTDEIEWLQDELHEIGRIVKTMDSLDFFVPQWESIEVDIVIFMDGVVESDISFAKLVRKIREEKPQTIILFIHLPDNDSLIESLVPYSVTCISFLDLEPGIIEAKLRGSTYNTATKPIVHDKVAPDYLDEEHEDNAQNSVGDTTEPAHDSEGIPLEPDETEAEDTQRERELKKNTRKEKRNFFDNIEKKKSAFLEKKQQAALQQIQPDLDIDHLGQYKKKAKSKTVFHGGTVVIAITGVERGVGVTHTAISIANYLASSKHRVALVETGNINDFVEIEAAYEGIGDISLLSNTTSFNLNGVRYFKNNSNVSMVELVTSDYAYVILDIGYFDESEWYSEFLRANIQIAVGSGSDWKQRDIIRFLENQIHVDQTKWRICLPMATNQHMKDLKTRLPKRKMYHVPFNPDPYDLHNDCKEALEELVMLNRQRKLSNIMKKIQSFVN